MHSCTLPGHTETEEVVAHNPFKKNYHSCALHADASVKRKQGVGCLVSENSNAKKQTSNLFAWIDNEV